MLESFLLDTLKTTFWMENSTQRWIQSGPFFSKSGEFFSIFKKGPGVLVSPIPPPCAPKIVEKSHNFQRLQLFSISHIDFLKFSENRDKSLNSDPYISILLLLGTTSPAAYGLSKQRKWP